MKPFQKILCATALMMLSATTAHAIVINGSVGGASIPFPNLGFGGFGAGPVNVTPDITWTSTNSNAVFGYSGSYGFSANGSWNGIPMAGLNTSGAGQSMTFAFATPVDSVGGQINWTTFGNATISVFDAGMNLIESLALFTGSNTQTPSSFLGFKELTANISFFVLSDSYIGIRNFEVGSQLSAVPVPAALPLLLTGLGGLVAGRRFRRKQKFSA